MNNNNQLLINVAKINTPEKVTNAVIQSIGQAYLKKYDEKNQSFLSIFWHNNHRQAKQLRDYDVESSPAEKYQMLKNVFLSLPNLNGELAQTLMSLFVHAFYVVLSITAKTTPKDIVRQMEDMEPFLLQRLLRKN